MKEIFQLLFMVTVLGVISCKNIEHNAIDSNYSSLIDVVHQDIDLQVDWEHKKLVGRTKLSINPLQEIDRVILNAAKLSVKLIQDKYGNELKFNINDSLQIISIGLGKWYDPDEELSIYIEYETQHQNQSDPANIWGSFGNGVRFFQPTKTENERRNQLWAFGEPQSSRYWFPSNDTPDDLRTTGIKIKVREQFMALSSGELISSVEKEGFKTYNWQSQMAYPPYQTFLVIGEYANIAQNFKQIQINNYGYPDEKVGTRESVISLPNMMEFFSEYTGTDYPYDSYNQIFVQDFGGWKPGLAASIITENMIDDKTTHKDFLYGWDLTEGEALASQWFGNYIKPKRWKDIWLAKGFSRYFSGLYNQFANGQTEFLTYQFSPDLSAYLNDWKAQTATRVVPNSISDLDAFVNGNAPYAKGARVLHMLRKELGEPKWKELVRVYCKDYGNKLVGTEDFIGLVNSISRNSMHWFFKQWVYGVGHPVFKIEKEYDQSSRILHLTVIQNQNVDSVIGNQKIPYFRGKVFLEINDQIEEIELEAKRTNKFDFQISKNPKVVNFDYEDTWIKESAFEKDEYELLEELDASKDVLHRIDAMQKLASIALNKSLKNTTKEAIKLSLQSKALNEEYWRIRLIALSQLVQLYPTDDYGKVILDGQMERLLLELVDKEESWVKAWAINFLGNTKNQKYVPIYLNGLKDYSDRVVFMSAIALGKSKDLRAYDALMNLPKKPSWKNQSLISAMYGLKELADPRAYNFTLQTLTDSKKSHWNLGTPIWDHRLAAANTLVALDKVDEGYELVLKQFEDAYKENNVNDIFYNTQLVSILGDPRGKEVFDKLEKKYESSDNYLRALEQLRLVFEKKLK